VLTQLLDVFGFLSVLLRGGALALQSLVLGGVLFRCWVLRPAQGLWRDKGIAQSCRRLTFWSAMGLAIMELFYVFTSAAILMGTTGLTMQDVVGAHFFIAGVAAAGAAAIVVAAITRPKHVSAVLLAASVVILSAFVMTSHAAGRMEHRPMLIGLTAMHQAATAAWIGGMPYLLLALARSREVRTAQFICRRFSRLATLSLMVLVGAGWGMSLVYVGSADAAYGTTYGVMLVSKIVLLSVLLVLGSLNFLIVCRLPVDAAGSLPCLRRFAEAELGIGFTLILAAASLTSQPPATDLISGRVHAAEIAARISPRWPRLVTPDRSALSPASALDWSPYGTRQSGLQSFVPGASLHANGPGDIAWSEYNHHWAGLIVLSAGLLAVMARSSHAAWGRHWPLAFLGLAVFLFLRADPENWPLGPRSFWQSFAVADVLQHRLFVVLIVAFSIFEWTVQTGRTFGRAALVFPAVCAAGGALLLTHSHSLGNVKEELLVEVSHIPLAILGVTAGWARWLELRLPSDRPRYILAGVWPVCFVLIGVVLLNYRES